MRMGVVRFVGRSGCGNHGIAAVLSLANEKHAIVSA
jgi:hypothetical protein